jgi:hypothetical protein
MKINYAKFISTILVIGVITFWILWTEYKSSSIKKNFSIVTGQIIGVTKETYKNKSKSIIYKYKVDGVIYKSENGINPCGDMTTDELRLLLVNNEFPVAYEKSDVSNSLIIISEKKAAEYKYTLTDIQKQVDSILTCK